MKTQIMLIMACSACLTAAASDFSLDIANEGNKNVALRFDTEKGNTYRLLIASAFGSDATWSSYKNFAGSGETVEVSYSATSQSGFFTLESRRNPLYGKNFYVDTNSAAQLWINKQKNLSTDEASTNIALMSKISTNPVAVWLTGAEGDVSAAVNKRMLQAQNQNQTPVFVLYNIPHRDCGNFSSGGSKTTNAYNAWIESVALSIGTNEVVVILEPDALANLDCTSLTNELKNERITLISNAVTTLKSQSAAKVYVDAGHSAWQPSTTMVDRLKKVGVDQADGFCLNVSNFQLDSKLIAYGQTISKRLNDMHFVIDTSRNGLGPNTDAGLKDSWCNPPGRALGHVPTADTGEALVDAFLWIKVPGESDGSCREGSPSVGIFWTDYALDLCNNARF